MSELQTHVSLTVAQFNLFMGLASRMDALEKEVTLQADRPTKEWITKEEIKKSNMLGAKNHDLVTEKLNELVNTGTIKKLGNQYNYLDILKWIDKMNGKNK